MVSPKATVDITFLSTPSARRATMMFFSCGVETEFLSTPSARRATSRRTSSRSAFGYFYPRPPRGGRPIPPQATGGILIFLSTPSARRATDHRPDLRLRRAISIHALREEGDEAALALSLMS